VNSNCRRSENESRSVREDPRGKKELRSRDSIQETGQEQRPARMVGLSSLESPLFSMEADDNQIQLSRQRGAA
jgi:hypothetical protein